MTAWETILSLWLGSVGLLAVEVFVPGMVLGAIGVLGLVLAIALAFAGHGPLAGVGVALGSLVVGGVLFKLGVGRLAHRHALAARGGTDDRSALVGRTGEATTVLRPGGYARIGGRRVDVVTAGEHLAAGTPVVVVKAEGNRIEVRAASPEPRG